MRKEKAFLISMGILMALVTIFSGISLYEISTTDNDWWTKVFCIIEDGKLQQKHFKDICWINSTKYVADFVGIGFTYGNLTNSDEIKKWQLVEVEER